jgi:hypothetical protein
MRYVEFKNGLQTFVSGEEQDLIETIDEKGLVAKKDFTEREQLVARRLAEKSILTRQKTNDKIYYKISRNADHHTTTH